MNQIAHVGVNVMSAGTKLIKLFGREIIFEVFPPVWKKTYLNVADRRTDRQTDGRTDDYHGITAR